MLDEPGEDEDGMSTSIVVDDRILSRHNLRKCAF